MKSSKAFLRGGVKGIPIGNLTSQLYANVYLNKLDHFIKDELRVKHYIRYTDDFVILHNNPAKLASLIPVVRYFLNKQLKLELHPKKVQIRKLRQGIDFLGYVALPHYCIWRTKSERRIWKQLKEWEPGNFASIESYLGMLRHCNGHKLNKKIRNIVNYNECWEYNIMFPK